MSLYSLTPSADATHPDEGTLHVEVPHWAAHVSVFDDRNQPVPGSFTIDTSRSTPETYEATLNLPAGIYQVEVALGGEARRELVPIHPQHATRLTREQTAAGRPLHIRSSAPLAGGADTPERHIKAAEIWSRQITCTTLPGGDSQLFLFVRALDAEAAPGWADGLKLLDAAGRLVTDFSSGVQQDMRQGWRAFNAKLPAGTYFLRRGGRGRRLRFQPLYLVDGWQTQVFLQADGHPRLHTQALSMARRGEGFIAHDDTVAAAEVLLAGLGGGTSGQMVLGAHTAALYSGRLSNPWLAIVAAHALHSELGRTRPEESAKRAANLLSGVLSRLEPLREHPDVAALLLAAGETAPAPFWSPPLLRAGLQLVQEHATGAAETVPNGSLTDLVLDSVIGGSPWTAWNTLSDLPVASASARSGVGRGRSLLKIRQTELPPKTRLIRYGLALARAATPVAPAFYLADTALETDWEVAAIIPAVLAQFAAPESAADATAQVAQSMIRPRPTEDAPDAITVDVAGQVDRLLTGVDAHAISVQFGLPLNRTQQSLQQLGVRPHFESDDAGAASVEDAIVRPGTERAVVSGVLAQTVRPIRQTIAPPTTRGDEVVRPTYIEEIVPKLLQDADRLRAADVLPNLAEEDAARARTVGDFLHLVADALLSGAGLTVLTDRDGRIVFGNGAFLAFVAHATRVDGEEVDPEEETRRQSMGKHAWEAALQDMPLGTSTLPVPETFTHHAGQIWHLQRTLVNDQMSGRVQAYLNVLHNPNGTRISGRSLRRVASLQPQLAVAVTLLLFGDAGERDQRLAQVETLAGQLAEAVGVADVEPGTMDRLAAEAIGALGSFFGQLLNRSIRTRS